jgi:hypothetical protein
MALYRNNDEERAAVVDRLLEQQRPQPARARVKIERRPLVERRRHRSDTELRAQRDDMQREWDAHHGGTKRKRSA